MDARVRRADPRVLALALTLGCAAVLAGGALPPAGPLAVLALPALIPWRFRLPWSIFVLGLLLGVWQAHVRLDDRWPVSRHGSEIEATGAVASLVERTGGGEGGATLRFEFRPDDAALPARIRAAWYRTGTVVRGGECWRLRLRMGVPRGSLDPGAF
ncbi:MAG TPA: DUF4131 domain-containing protein, partial [Nevskiaceae bacterium]|nr:DUF4131 domain-containing protein [Nevskiaceae bacterium]